MMIWDTSYQRMEIRMPAIDNFANEGIRLQQHYVQQVCSPTRPAIMVGCYPYRMGIAHEVIGNKHTLGMPLNQTAIANELKKDGYSTYAVGKWDLGMQKWECTPTYIQGI